MAKSSVDTPLMRQYLEVKGRYADAILLFRLGDFYEMFFEDAVTASRLLELTLTTRDRDKEDPVPMCGIPHHARAGYIRRLLDGGHRVVLCDQVEDAKQARGLIRRDVTRVITPGVVLDLEHLDARSNNYLLAIAPGAEERCGIAAFDLSTFELWATEVRGPDAVLDELARIRPREVIFDGAAEQAIAPLREGRELSFGPAVWQRAGEGHYSKQTEENARLVEAKALADLGSVGLAGLPLALEAAAAALRYVESTQPASGIPVCRLLGYRPADHLQLDESTLANLEILESLMERRREGSLIWALDDTVTAMGARMLRRTLTRPLVEVAAIRRRHDAVEWFVEDPELRAGIRESIRGVHDLERLASRVALGLATPRELSRLGRSLRLLPGIAAALRAAAARSIDRELPALLVGPAGASAPDLLEDVSVEIERILVDEAPPTLKEGGAIRSGFNPELDRLVRLAEGGREEILAIEARERARTGIASLRVRYNRVFGYYLEVTRSHLKSVPADYQRKQTLAGAERFITPELAEHEAAVLTAEEKRVALEEELFLALRSRVARHAPRLAAAASWVATLDVFASLAEVAVRHGYQRPVVDEGGAITIEQGRHPVVERFLPAGQFVPNDVSLDPEEGRVLVLTGPNMAGKSTVMRQVALIVLMAQAGSFVPARAARIGVADRLFTRVGASDNLARGESTFMVEMRETAAILRGATARSLVVIDEIGRGTATYDGISIAWAVAEHLHDRVRARCLFATHYHELCALAEVKPHARNFNVAVEEYQGKVVFLRRLEPGGSSRSYGIEVARIAGLDRSVVARARRVLVALEEGSDPDGEIPIRSRFGGASGQLSLFAPRTPDAASPTGGDPRARAERDVLDEILALDLERTTPIEALVKLTELREKLSSEDSRAKN
jgi:DNA mismatch repair protein MutS